MASLIEKSACDGLLPRVAGGTVLSELPAARVTSVAPFAGKTRALGAALKEMGLSWPKPGKRWGRRGPRSSGRAGIRPF
ncbi:MAG: hypothetical protein R3D46_10330 [Defluviimonas denitrificans]